MSVSQEKSGVLFRSTDSIDLQAPFGVSQVQYLSTVLRRQPERLLLHTAEALANSYQTIAAFVGR